MSDREPPQACVIEIVERVPAGADPDAGPGFIVPNEIRINGTPVLAPKDYPVRVHDIQIDGTEPVQVTLTLFARRVVVQAEA